MKLLALLVLAAAPAAALTPSGYLKFDVAPAEIAQRCGDAQKRAEMGLRAVSSLPETTIRFENTVGALEQAVWTLLDTTASDTFLKDVSVSSSVRQAGMECQTGLEKFMIDVYTRE